MKRLLIAAAAMAAAAGAAQAQSVSSGPMPVIGTVPTICAATPLEGDGTIFDVGTLIDTSTGFLRGDLSVEPKVLSASFCNARSTISVTAEPMTAQSFPGAPSAGFSKAVDFTATASGWTETAAAYDTGAESNPQASQSRASAHSGDIVVSLSGFAVQGGASLRPVADPEYRGQVVVTLAVAD